MTKIITLFFCITLTMPLAAMHPEPQDSPYEKLIKTYSTGATAQLKQTTRNFMAQFPYAPESLILQRYVDEFVKNALTYRPPGQRPNIIGREFGNALISTPVDGARLNYILTGDENRSVSGTLSGMAVAEWKLKLQEIEQEIASRP